MGDPSWRRSKLIRAPRAGSFTILRPTVIYGSGEKGNFAAIHMISRLPIPLPFGALTAQRSVLSVENFNSAAATVLTGSACARRNVHRVGSEAAYRFSN